MTAPPRLEDLSWDDLRHLEAVDRLGSATAASRELRVSASTVYRRIASLEQSLGLPCYSRGEGVTGVGAELAELARETTNGLHQIRRRALEDHDEVRGRITLTTIDGFVPLLVEPLAALAARHPELEVVLDVSNEGLSVRRGEAEIGLTALPDPGPQLVGRRLFTIDFGVFGVQRWVDAYETAPWVILAPPLSNSAIGKWEREVTTGRRVALATPSRRALNELVAAGVGLGAVPRRLALRHPELVEVEALAERAAELSSPAWLLTHPHLREHAAVATVMRTLSEFLADGGRS